MKGVICGSVALW